MYDISKLEIVIWGKHYGRLFSNVDWCRKVELFIFNINSRRVWRKVENASGRPNHYREAQIKRIRDRVATKPDITFARLRADLNLETADLRQLAREAGVELR